MPEFKFLTASSSIRNDSDASDNINDIAVEYSADSVDPIRLRCGICTTEWEFCPVDNFSEATCSNCYADSDQLVIVRLRLMFQDWGEQNGGESEQRLRYENAKLKLAVPTKETK